MKIASMRNGRFFNSAFIANPTLAFALYLLLSSQQQLIDDAFNQRYQTRTAFSLVHFEYCPYNLRTK